MAENDYKALAGSIADKYGVPQGVLFGLIKQESRWNPVASNHGNKDGTYDFGIMQLNSKYYPDAAAMTVKQQFEIGAKKVKDNYVALGSWYEAVRAYNVGLSRAKTNPDIGKNNADKVMANAKDYGFTGDTPNSVPVNPSSVYDTVVAAGNNVVKAVKDAVKTGADTVKAGADDATKAVSDANPVNKINANVSTWIKDNATVALLVGIGIIFVTVSIIGVANSAADTVVSGASKSGLGKLAMAAV